MDDPQLELEQIGHKWRVIRIYPNGKRVHCTFPVSRKEAEWFLNQLRNPTDDANDEWAEIKIEAEKEDNARMLEMHRPYKLKWVRKARAEGRLPRPPYEPMMTKRRYLKLLERARLDEEAKAKGEPS